MRHILCLLLALGVSSIQASSLMGGSAPSLGSGDVNQTASNEPTGPAYLVLYDGAYKSSVIADIKANDLAYITSRHCNSGSCVTKHSKGRLFGNGSINGGVGFIVNGGTKRYYTTEVLISHSSFGSIWGPPSHSNTPVGLFTTSPTYYCSLIFDKNSKRFTIAHDAVVGTTPGCTNTFACPKQITISSGGSKCNGSGISKITVMRNGA